jgi:hypothetical protein
VEPGQVSCAYRGQKELEEAGVSPATAESFSLPLRPFDSGFELQITVQVEEETSGAAIENEVTVSGGGGPLQTIHRPVPISETSPEFGVQDYELRPEEAGGVFDDQAGSHPFQLTSFLAFNQNSEALPLALPRDLSFPLPAGLVGAVAGRPQCSETQFSNEACPPQAAVGAALVTYALPQSNAPTIVATFFKPVFNMVPNFGEPAKFAFGGVALPLILDTALRSGPGEDYGVTVSSSNVTQIDGLLSTEVTFWGTPGDPVHDGARGNVCLEEGQQASGCSALSEKQPTALLTMPTSCPGTPFAASMTARSWLEGPEGAHPGAEYTLRDSFGSPLTLEGCNQLGFAPALEAAPTTGDASAPSGLDVNLNVKDEGLLSQEGRAQSQLKNTTVTLPEGFTINPSAGVGLSGCTRADYAKETADSAPGEGCPNSSKLGEVTIESPLVSAVIHGSLFIAQPYENPFSEAGHPNGSLVAIYVVAKNPETGVLVKLAGKVTPNPLTGQLTTTFENNPQLPFSHFNFHFREGQQAPLISPPACGTYATQAQLTPWSDPSSVLTDTSLFTITKGYDGGACPPAGPPPFHPQIEAGSLNNNAGAFSPFYVHLTRTDGEQEISGFSTDLPEGLTGDLSGIPFCPEAAIALSRTKSGAQEEAEPSCPAASQIGHTLVGTGVGAVLAYVPGKIYLAGPYHGDPFSLVSVTSARVGPFDLGTVVIRFALRIDPTTAQVSVDPSASEPIPHIIDGIVTHVRDIRVYVNRENFTLNPTSCNPMQISSTLSSGQGQSATISSPFQASNCQALAFKPQFNVSTSGRTSRKDGASLAVKLTYPTSVLGKQANIAMVKVDLPKQLPSRLTTLQKACTASQFEANPAGCPSESIVGHAKAITPILPVPLEGPAYFVSHGGAKFPELIIVLQGYGVTLDLHGETFISKAGITSSTFRSVPDDPIGSFELTLPEGTDSALAANGNLCKSKLVMPTAFTAQDGVSIHQSTPITITGCKPAIGVVSHSVKGAKVTIRATVPAAGKLSARGNGLSGAAKSTKAAGTVTLGLALTKAERALLARRRGRSLRVRVQLLFAPKHGSRIAGSVTVFVH